MQAIAAAAGGDLRRAMKLLQTSGTDEDRAWDLCLSLSEEYGYAQVRQNGMIIGDYTDGHA